MSHNAHRALCVVYDGGLLLGADNAVSNTIVLLKIHIQQQQQQQTEEVDMS